ncbi:FAD/NAD(P)-binding protein [Luteimonas saliphila]|uniref:FAD/NAD(P)-binding protein n=1 Tax=Luteimonas saliphila TaxID=2804919 RepID=UPI00192DA52C|nr:FAD/NAD(P)-binding protein [Luteimonas saliphila]
MRITIIGAGFSGSTLATLLASPRDDAPEVCLVGTPATFGSGVAYGEARQEHLLNVRARHLGMDPEHTGDFADWLSLGERGRDGFMPRIAYGDYLRDRLKTAVEQSSNLTCIDQEVIAVERTLGGFRVYLADGGQFFSDRVVLAPGALPPQRLAGVGPRLARSERYIGWPWQEDAIDRIPPDARVLLVGTGLTMADVVVSLRRRRHQGGIVAISRRGLLPRSHLPQPSEVVALPPRVLYALRAGDLHALLAALRSLATAVVDWRALVDALRPHTQAFWRGLSPVQRARFARHLRTHWETFRHRLAPQVATELEALLVSGQLQVRAARLLRAGVVEDGIEVLLRGRGQAQAQVERFDFMVRATGLDTDIERTTHPLVTHLREAGQIRADPLGFGIEVDEDFSVIDNAGRAVSGLYCLGPLLRGHLWEITAIPELRDAAGLLAQRLMARERSAPGGAASTPRWPLAAQFENTR